jgi:hypothetical protein
VSAGEEEGGEQRGEEEEPQRGRGLQDIHDGGIMKTGSGRD